MLLLASLRDRGTPHAVRAEPPQDRGPTASEHAPAGKAPRGRPVSPLPHGTGNAAKGRTPSPLPAKKAPEGRGRSTSPVPAIVAAAAATTLGMGSAGQRSVSPAPPGARKSKAARSTSPVPAALSSAAAAAATAAGSGNAHPPRERALSPAPGAAGPAKALHRTSVSASGRGAAGAEEAVQQARTGARDAATAAAAAGGRAGKQHLPGGAAPESEVAAGRWPTDPDERDRGRGMHWEQRPAVGGEQDTVRQHRKSAGEGRQGVEPGRELRAGRGQEKGGKGGPRINYSALWMPELDSPRQTARPGSQHLHQHHLPSAGHGRHHSAGALPAREPESEEYEEDPLPWVGAAPEEGPGKPGRHQMPQMHQSHSLSHRTELQQPGTVTVSEEGESGPVVVVLQGHRYAPPTPHLTRVSSSQGATDPARAAAASAVGSRMEAVAAGAGAELAPMGQSHRAYLRSVSTDGPAEAAPPQGISRRSPLRPRGEEELSAGAWASGQHRGGAKAPSVWPRSASTAAVGSVDVTGECQQLWLHEEECFVADRRPSPLRAQSPSSWPGRPESPADGVMQRTPGFSGQAPRSAMRYPRSASTDSPADPTLLLPPSAAASSSSASTRRSPLHLRREGGSMLEASSRSSSPALPARPSSAAPAARPSTASSQTGVSRATTAGRDRSPSGGSSHLLSSNSFGPSSCFRSPGEGGEGGEPQLFRLMPVRRHSGQRSQGTTGEPTMSAGGEGGSEEAEQEEGLSRADHSVSLTDMVVRLRTPRCSWLTGAAVPGAGEGSTGPTGWAGTAWEEHCEDPEHERPPMPVAGLGTAPSVPVTPQGPGWKREVLVPGPWDTPAAKGGPWDLQHSPVDKERMLTPPPGHMQSLQGGDGTVKPALRRLPRMSSVADGRETARSERRVRFLLDEPEEADSRSPVVTPAGSLNGGGLPAPHDPAAAAASGGSFRTIHLARSTSDAGKASQGAAQQYGYKWARSSEGDWGWMPCDRPGVEDVVGLTEHGYQWAENSQGQFGWVAVENQERLSFLRAGTLATLTGRGGPQRTASKAGSSGAGRAAVRPWRVGGQLLSSGKPAGEKLGGLFPSGLFAGKSQEEGKQERKQRGKSPGSSTRSAQSRAAPAAAAAAAAAAGAAAAGYPRSSSTSSPAPLQQEWQERGSLGGGGSSSLEESQLAVLGPAGTFVGAAAPAGGAAARFPRSCSATSQANDGASAPREHVVSQDIGTVVTLVPDIGLHMGDDGDALVSPLGLEGAPQKGTREKASVGRSQSVSKTQSIRGRSESKSERKGEKREKKVGKVGKKGEKKAAKVDGKGEKDGEKKVGKKGERREGQGKLGAPGLAETAPEKRVERRLSDTRVIIERTSDKRMMGVDEPNSPAEVPYPVRAKSFIDKQLERPSVDLEVGLAGVDAGQNSLHAMGPAPPMTPRQAAGSRQYPLPTHEQTSLAHEPLEHHSPTGTRAPTASAEAGGSGGVLTPKQFQIQTQVPPQMDGHHGSDARDAGSVGPPRSPMPASPLVLKHPRIMDICREEGAMPPRRNSSSEE